MPVQLKKIASNALPSSVVGTSPPIAPAVSTTKVTPSVLKSASAEPPSSAVAAGKKRARVQFDEDADAISKRLKAALEVRAVYDALTRRRLFVQKMVSFTKTRNKLHSSFDIHLKRLHEATSLLNETVEEAKDLVTIATEVEEGIQRFDDVGSSMVKEGIELASSNKGWTSVLDWANDDDLYLVQTMNDNEFEVAYKDAKKMHGGELL